MALLGPVGGLKGIMVEGSETTLGVEVAVTAPGTARLPSTEGGFGLATKTLSLV